MVPDHGQEPAGALRSAAVRARPRPAAEHLLSKPGWLVTMCERPLLLGNRRLASGAIDPISELAIAMRSAGTS